jgi:hypothetical protein
MLTNVAEIDIEFYERNLDLVCTGGGNLLVIGQAGIGKTAIPFQRAAKHRLKVVYWNLSTQEAPDLVGLPIIKVENGVEVVRYASPEFMPVCERYPDPVLVVVDEIDKCKSELQNPLLEVFQSHTLNGRKLNIRGIVSTGNLPDEGAFSKPISHALTNRCKTYKLTSDFASWQSWAGENGINSLVSAFLSRNKDLLSQKPNVSDPTAYTRGSPRSWSAAGVEIDKIEESVKNKVISFGDLDKELDFKTMAIAGFVGMSSAVQFRVWLDYAKKLEPVINDLVYKDKQPTEAQVNDMGPTGIIVLGTNSVRAIVDLASQKAPEDKIRKEILKATESVFKFLKTVPPEFQITACKASALTIDFIKTWGLTNDVNFMTVFKSVRAVQT